MNPEILARLRTVLAKLYSDESSIRRVIADAGIDAARIDLDSTAINNWHAVLIEAENTGRANTLLSVVEQEYPDNLELRNTCVAYRQAGEQTGQNRRHDPAPVSSEPSAQKGKPRKQKSTMGIVIIVALIGAFATVVAALVNFVPTLFAGRTTPTVVASPTAMPTTVPTIAPTPVAMITPTNTVQPFATPIILPRPVRVGIAHFDQCDGEDVANQLAIHMKPYLGKSSIEVGQLPLINTREQARSQTETEIVIWGVCTFDNEADFHAELNLFHSQAMGRVAEPETVQITWGREALDLPAKVLAATALYAQQTSTAESVALLKQTVSQWQSTEEISLHWVLGNALLGHTETSFSADAQREFETIIYLWESSGYVDGNQHALIYNNLGMALVRQKKRPDAIEAFRQAIQANPNYVWPYISRSEVYARIQQNAEAEADCKQVIVLEPIKGYVCRTLADYFAGNYNNIVVDAQQASAIDPKDAFVQLVNALSACQLGDTTTAFKHIEIFYQQAFARLNRWERDHTLVVTIAANFVDHYQDGC